MSDTENTNVDPNIDLGSLMSKMNDNPELLKKAIETAKGLIGAGFSIGNISENNEDGKEEALSKGSGMNQKIMLLTALRPYLNPERRKKIDYLIGILRLLGMSLEQEHKSSENGGE